jgi:hypothetical protein
VESTAQTREAGATSQAAEQSPPAGENQGKKPEKSSGANANPKQPRGISPADSSPLPNEGTEAVAPGVPTVKHGDNSIQSYGTESASDERVQAATTVKAYLDAQIAGRWSEACNYLAATIQTHLEVLLKQASKSQQQGCPAAMEALVGPIPKGPLRTIAEIHVLSMRVEDDRGFLIFDDGEAKSDEIPMQREAGQWKVRALVAKDLIAG